MTQQKVRMLEDRLLYEGWNTLRQLSLEYQHDSGVVQHLQRELYVKSPGAGVLLYNEVNDTVVLVKQFRTPLFYLNEEPMLVEVCAGLLDGEDPETAIKREILEETGYQVDHVDFVMKVFTSPGVVTEYLMLYTANIRDTQRIARGGGLVEEGEEIELIEWPLSLCEEKLMAGEIQDAKTVILLQNLLIKQAKTRHLQKK
ncbi:NUDIX domain-containing protein [Leeia sp. TBRC 13508]|uniref:GDP-mannose pyrophosphatase n=1 Tax=Leeia speluncae TaxID=2884804 RepID=A0ABS8D8E4_9NEIS|nr:NUDIX domain-containing protein [Leeia speluncae]MCB6184486.1 NUDIX domain-containing protein [Leeia speluncae]